MPEEERQGKLLLVGAAARLRPAVGAWSEILEAPDGEAAYRLCEREAPDVILAAASAAGPLIVRLAEQEDAPPLVVVGGGAEGAFGAAASEVELPAWLGAARVYRRLQKQNQLIRQEAERIHSEMLTSYGEVREHSLQLEEEVKRRTVELRQHAETLEKQVEERTQALQKSNATLVEQDKMAALGALVSGIAHDLHTPIGTITSNSDILVRSLGKFKDLLASEACPEAFRSGPEMKRVLSILDEISRVNQVACDRIIGIIRSLRNFARLDEAEVRSTDLHECLESTLTLVHHQLKNRIKVERQYGQIPRVPCHANQLSQVFMNLLVNASHAIAEKGTVTIRTFREEDLVKVQISDTGSGIKPENLSKIFDTGFTTKVAGVGTGLGLAICSKIIQDHHGRIDVESEVGRGTTFTISLPVEWKTSPAE